jgi:hypothetical protein
VSGPGFELEGERFDAGKHAPRCLVCLEQFTELDEVVHEVAGWVDDPEAGGNNSPIWWTTFRFAHRRCAESEMDAREVRYRLANPDDDKAPA